MKTSRYLSFSALAITALACSSAFGHELWFQPKTAQTDSVRLTFGDSPAPGEAERVAEIEHAKVWGDGKALEVKRLPDGLEALLPKGGADVLSAYADRGIIDYQGDTFVIFLAAYSQEKPLKLNDSLKLGLDDHQLRLLMVDTEGGRSVVRAFRHGKPVSDVVVTVFQGGASTEVRTDTKGEFPTPDLRKGPVSLLATWFDKTPGKRDGRDYTHTRYKATLTIASE